MVSQKDLTIVMHLRHNARIKLRDLARITKTPVSTLFGHMQNLPDHGVTKLTALLDFARLGYFTIATLLLKATGDRRDQLKQYLLDSPEVNSLMRVNNGYDFMAECIFKDMRALEEFCDCLERTHGVKTKEVHYVVEELKREAFLSTQYLEAEKP